MLPFVGALLFDAIPIPENAVVVYAKAPVAAVVAISEIAAVPALPFPPILLALAVAPDDA